MKKSIKFIIYILVFLLPIAPSSMAGLESLPFFGSIKFNKVNGRSGPGKKYPIEWVYQSNKEPVKIIAIYDQWRKIIDTDNVSTWIHVSTVSKIRHIIVLDDKTHKLLHRKPNNASVITSKIAPGVRCRLYKCINKWCQVKCDNQKGWLTCHNIWGLYESECSQIKK